MSYSRRDFIKTSIFAGATFLFAGRSPAHSNVKVFKNNSRVAFVVFPTFDPAHVEERKDGSVKILNLNDGSSVDFQVNSNAHMCIPHPVRKNSLILLPRGPGELLEVDPYKKETLNRIASSENHHFWGHAVFIEDKFFVSEIDSRDHFSGVISVRSPLDFKVQHLFDTFGFVHQCKKDTLSNDLVAAGVLKTNDPKIRSKFDSSMRWFDLKNYQLTRQVFCEDRGSILAHFDQGQDGKIVATAFTLNKKDDKGGCDPGYVYFIKPGDEIAKRGKAPKDVEAKMIGQALSQAVNFEKNIALVTHPKGDMITLWDIDEAKLITSKNISVPVSVVLSSDNQFFILTTKEETHLINVVTLKTEYQLKHGGSGTCAHMSLLSS